MTLSALIRGKRKSSEVATAIPAIPATDAAADGQERVRTVARIATVAVANSSKRIVSPRDTAADFDSEHFEERAAIYEFDAGFPRHEAERLARKEILKWTKMN